MSVSGARASYGHKFYLGDYTGTEGAYAEVGEVTRCGLPSIKKRYKEVSHHQSPEATAQKKPTFVDIGSFTVDLNLDMSSPNTTRLILAAKDLTPYYCRVTNAAGKRWYGPAGVDFDPGERDFDGIDKATITVEPVGAWVEESGA